MKIVILGAGQVGSTIAENLVTEDNDVTVVDSNTKALDAIASKYDLRTIEGNASLPSTLRQAGLSDADLLIATTNSDEVNMVACQVAHALFDEVNKIARIRNGDYLKEKEKLFNQKLINIDHIITPERLVVEEVCRLIEYPGALQVSTLVDGKVSVVVTQSYYGGVMVGSPISAIRDFIPHVDNFIVAIGRKGKVIRPQGSTIIEAGDEITFICATDHIKAVISVFQRLEHPYKRIMIVGGGSIALGVAKKLENQYQVKLIERNPKQASFLSEELSNTLVFNGDSADESLLFEENIGEVDAFLCLTSDDETNIMSALLAKRMGAKNALVIIQRMAYLNLLQGGGIDIAISPQQSTVSAMLRHVRPSNVVGAISMRNGIAEVEEISIMGDAETSNVVGRMINEISLPQGCVIGAVYRDDEVIVGKSKLELQAQDRVVVYLNNKKLVAEVRKVFA